MEYAQLSVEGHLTGNDLNSEWGSNTATRKAVQHTLIHRVCVQVISPAVSPFLERVDAAVWKAYIYIYIYIYWSTSNLHSP